MTSTRPGCMKGSAARSAWVMASSDSAAARTRSAGIRARWMASGVVRRQRQGERGDRRDRAGEADEAPIAGEATVSSASVERRRDVGRAAAICVGGRRVGVQVPLGHPHAADVDRPGRLDVGRSPQHELGRAAADVDDEVRGPAAPTARRSPVAPVKDNSRLLVAGDHLGATRGRRTRRAPRRRTRPGCAASRDAEVATKRTRSAPERRGTARRTRGHRRRCAPSPPGRCRRCGRRPARAARSPSGGRRRSARPSWPTSATSSRIELVPQSMAATRAAMPSLTARCRPPSRRGPASGRIGRAGCRCPPLVEHLERLVAERVDARARRPSEWATSTCRHLTRSGMPPAETPAISGTSPSCVAAPR